MGSRISCCDRTPITGGDIAPNALLRAEPPRSPRTPQVFGAIEGDNDNAPNAEISEAAICKSVAEGLPLAELMKALRDGAARKSLRFTSSELTNFSAAELKALWENLPEQLESLTVDFSSCGLRRSQLADVAALGAGLE